MDWIEISDVTPNTETTVLLFASYEQNGHRASMHCIGALGGCKNAPEVIIDIGNGNKKPVKASHWCKLTKP